MEKYCFGLWRELNPGDISMNQKIEKRSPVLENMEHQAFLKGYNKAYFESYIEGYVESYLETAECKLKVLNDIAMDSNNDLTLEELSNKCGFDVDEILTLKVNQRTIAKLLISLMKSLDYI